MDMRLDEAGADEPAVTLHFFSGVALEAGRQRHDAPVLHADVGGGGLAGPGVGKPNVTQDEIESHCQLAPSDALALSGLC